MDVNSKTNIIFDPGDNNIPNNPFGRSHTNKARNEAADNELLNEYDAVINLVLDRQRVQTANLMNIRTEVQEKRLDTRKNAWLAAQNILKFGI